MRASYNAIQPYAPSREEARYNNRCKQWGRQVDTHFGHGLRKQQGGFKTIKKKPSSTKP
jgi:hypothetical protein